jgi:hypothetical protein
MQTLTKMTMGQASQQNLEIYIMRCLCLITLFARERERGMTWGVKVSAWIERKKSSVSLNSVAAEIDNSSCVMRLNIMTSLPRRRRGTMLRME